MKTRAYSSMIAMAVVAVVLLLVPALGGCSAASSGGPDSDAVAQAAEGVSGWLRLNVTHEGYAEDEFVSVVDNLYDWPQIALVRYDGTGFPDYQALTERFVSESWQGEDGFRDATDLARLILAVSVTGGDARNVGGHDLISALCNHSRFDMQGVNGPIFGLIALDCRGYEVPAGRKWTRERMLELVLEYRNSDGSLELSGSGEGDPDVTAMAIQAVWRYADDPEVEQAIADAVDWLSEAQRDDGGYASLGHINSESAAQVVVALSALGIDAATDPDFDKEGKDPLSYLFAYQEADGGFSHTLGEGSDKIASEQALLALDAWLLLQDGEQTLYDYGE